MTDLRAQRIPRPLREVQGSLGRSAFAAQAQAENTTKAYTADLEDFRHWCKKFGREWLPAGPETIGLYLGARPGQGAQPRDRRAAPRGNRALT